MSQDCTDGKFPDVGPDQIPSSSIVNIFNNILLKFGLNNDVLVEATPLPLISIYPKNLKCSAESPTTRPSPISLQTLLHLRKPVKWWSLSPSEMLKTSATVYLNCPWENKHIVFLSLFPVSPPWGLEKNHPGALYPLKVDFSNLVWLRELSGCRKFSVRTGFSGEFQN